jgi:hypothetical protein
LSDVSRVFDLFNQDFFRTHVLFLVEYEPPVPIARFEIFYQPTEVSNDPFRNPPAAILGVVETLTRAEVIRESAEHDYQEEMEDVVVNSLEEGDKRPLFAPDTLYTVSVSFQGQIRKSNNHAEVNTLNTTQQFRFRTAAIAPPRLNPWVLATLPEADAPTHFSEDPMQFIFNDAAAIQLYKAFGKTLNAVLRKANGNHPPERPTIDPSTLQPILGQIASPFATSMAELAEELPCVDGIFETEQHQVFTIDIPLDRGTSYILDIESTPPPADPKTPLFRTAFTTSRYTGAGELANVVQTSFIQERALKGTLTLPLKSVELIVPDDSTPSRTATIQVQVVTDAEMEAALLAATGSDVPPPRHPGLTLLWSAALPSRPVALLVDAPESLLRTRPVPVEVSTPTPDGDLIQHFQNGKQLYLEVIEKATAMSERIVYATGGCRLLIFLKEGATGSINLALRQYRHTLLTTDPLSRDFTLVEMPLPAQAPWEI